MSEHIEQFKSVFDLLEFANTPGLITGHEKDKNNHKCFNFNHIKKTIDIDAAYFVSDSPIIFFKYFSKIDEQQINLFHQKVWNQGSIPLLFIMSPEQLRIYSGYKAPVLKNNKISAENALLVTVERSEKKELNLAELKDFSRIEIDTGNIWRSRANDFPNDDRVNQHLLHNLKHLRKNLAAKGLSFEHAHNLIGRSVIILYLQHRNILKETFFNKINAKSKSYSDILGSKNDTFECYSTLSEFYGKDIFPVSPEEKKAITNQHLALLKDIIYSSKLTETWMFWAFSFDVIPIELICSIYEEFLYGEEKKAEKEMASYTPPALAKVMLNQVMPYDIKYHENMKILDPACGSSIFLIEAYSRLVEKWIISNKYKIPSMKELNAILTNNIFGFDLNIEALRFTASSLFLSTLDFMETIDIDQKEKFASLIGKNLVEADFFDSKSPLHKNKYDIIIGNPPWQSNYGEKAKDYLNKTKHPVGDKQISQVFLWQAGDMVNEDGQICILMPSKGLLYNFNPKNTEFRDKFFKTFNIKKIVNLSLFSNLLFENSKFPASIIVYSLEKEANKSKSTVYYTPKPSHKFWEFATLIVDPADVKRLPKQQVLKDQTIWKIAYVGSGRDFVLANHLDKHYPKIDYICEDRNWKYGEGFQLGGGDKNVNKEMSEMLYIPAKSIYPFYVDKTELEKLGESVFHRPRDFDLYKAPHTIVRGGQIFASYIDYDAVFTHAVMCFSSAEAKDSNLLKLLAAYLNSSLALCYLFLTSSTWCIERADIHLAEYRTLPFTIPSDKKLLDNVLTTYDKLSELVSKDIKGFQDSKEYLELKKLLDNYIFDIFNLNEEQRQIIIDINDYGISYFQDYSKSSKFKEIPYSLRKPEKEDLKAYALTFCRLLNKELNKHNYKLTAKVYSGHLPLEVMGFTLVPTEEEKQDLTIVEDGKIQANTLKKLDTMVLKQTKESLYLTKNLRIYEGNTFYIVKPSEARFWNKSMAFNDADKNIKEILKGFKTVR